MRKAVNRYIQPIYGIIKARPAGRARKQTIAGEIPDQNSCLTTKS